METIVSTSASYQDSPGVNLMPPTVFYTCLVCGAVMEFFFPSNFTVLPVPMRIGIGVLLGGAGFAFMAVAHESLKRIGTAIQTNRSASAFVTRGPYRFSRHPMYVGGLAFFVGIGLIAGSLWILTFAIPLALYLALYVVPREEDYLVRTFGDDFRQYCRKVRRWL